MVIRRIDPNETRIITLEERKPSVPFGDYLKQLNDVQRDAVTTVDGPSLIVAGAGSGKTRVLTFRVAYLLSQGVKAWNILALTFTNKAAAEMKERISTLVDESQARPLWMGTFHSIFSRILRREAERLNYTSSFTIYDTDDSVSVVRAAMAQHGISTQDFSPKMFLSRISSAKNSLVSPQAYLRNAFDYIEQKVGPVYETYEAKLRGNNAMDFDDLLVKTIELFQRYPDALARYQDQFRYILIDEYQDTNRAQYTVVKLLAARHGNICVVGDDAQSIYRFRGADIRNILDFERDYPNHRIFRLEQNYRSTKNILTAADDVIKNNRNQIRKTLWTENDIGEKLRVVTLRDEREEGEELAKLIQRESRRGRTLNDVAVLYRTNSQSLSIEDALRRANIPYGLVGGVAFYKRKEVKDALAYMRLVVNDRDDEAFLRGVNTPARGVGEVTIKRLRSFAAAKELSLMEVARNPKQVPDVTPRVGNILSKFVELVDARRRTLTDLPLAESMRMLLSESGLLQSYRDEGTPEAIARWDNVQRILSHVAEYAADNPEATLDQYLQDISLMSDADSYDALAERVTLMTIHSAKGLEFGLVVVVGMEEGLFPIGNAAQNQDELEEERRLFYVAVTRAKEHLVLTNCERRYRFGELSYPTPSRFLNEIRSEVLEFNATAPSRPAGGRETGGGRVAERGGEWSFSRQPPPQQQSQQPRPAAQDSKAQPRHEYDQTSPDQGSDDLGGGDDFSQMPKEVRVGSVVVHPQFGRGKVELVVGTGDRTKLTVRFDSVGRKQLMLKFSHLRVV